MLLVKFQKKKNNQIYRVSKALELFIYDNPQLEKNLMLYAQRRLTARSWRFAKRFKNAKFFSVWFLLYLRGLLNINSDILETCKRANSIYKEFID
tara:strand:+ start:206 stop:490 length:285 start_codon:yes stop_codon:yes gene_type:complete